MCPQNMRPVRLVVLATALVAILAACSLGSEDPTTRIRAPLSTGRSVTIGIEWRHGSLPGWEGSESAELPYLHLPELLFDGERFLLLSTGAVFSSLDGASWDRAELAGTIERAGQATTAWSGRILRMTVRDGTAHMVEIDATDGSVSRASLDLGEWSALGIDDDIEGSLAMGAGGAAAILGNRFLPGAEVFFRPPGGSWRRLTDPFDGKRASEIVAVDHGFIARGSSDVWVSGDGASWTHVDAPSMPASTMAPWGDAAWVYQGDCCDSPSLSVRSSWAIGEAGGEPLRVDLPRLDAPLWKWSRPMAGNAGPMGVAAVFSVEARSGGCEYGVCTIGSPASFIEYSPDGTSWVRQELLPQMGEPRGPGSVVVGGDRLLVVTDGPSGGTLRLWIGTLATA